MNLKYYRYVAVSNSFFYYMFLSLLDLALHADARTLARHAAAAAPHRTTESVVTRRADLTLPVGPVHRRAAHPHHHAVHHAHPLQDITPVLRQRNLDQTHHEGPQILIAVVGHGHHLAHQLQVPREAHLLATHTPTLAMLTLHPWDRKKSRDGPPLLMCMTVILTETDVACCAVIFPLLLVSWLRCSCGCCPQTLILPLNTVLFCGGFFCCRLHPQLAALRNWRDCSHVIHVSFLFYTNASCHASRS